MQKLANEEGVAANNLQIKWMVPLHCEAITAIVSKCKKLIIVENNYSGQFARYLRSETSIVADGHIRKYDGEPFMPHHIVDGVKEILAGTDTAICAGARDYGLEKLLTLRLAWKSLPRRTRNHEVRNICYRNFHVFVNFV